MSTLASVASDCERQTVESFISAETATTAREGDYADIAAATLVHWSARQKVSLPHGGPHYKDQTRGWLGRPSSDRAILGRPDPPETSSCDVDADCVVQAARAETLTHPTTVLATHMLVPLASNSDTGALSDDIECQQQSSTTATAPVTSAQSSVHSHQERELQNRERELQNRIERFELLMKDVARRSSVAIESLPGGSLIRVRQSSSPTSFPYSDRDKTENSRRNIQIMLGMMLLVILLLGAGLLIGFYVRSQRH